MREFTKYLFLTAFVFVGISLNLTSSAHAQETINPVSGRLVLNETDLVLQRGATTLLIQRTFQPRESESGSSGRWQLNWTKSLVKNGPMLVVRESPVRTAFTQEAGSGKYKSASGEEIVFQKDGQAIRSKLDGTKERYDAKGRLVESEFLNKNKVRLIYSADGRLQRIEGPEGAFLKFTRDDKGLLTSIESSTGTVARYGYDKSALTEIQINNNPPIKYAYNNKGDLIKIERPLTGSVEITYDAKARVIKRRWADGSEERYEYDDANNILRQINPSGGVTATRRSKDGLQEEVTDPLGNKTLIQYNKLGLPVSTTGPTGITSKFAYDDLGRTAAVEGYFGESIRFEYVGNSPLPKHITYSDGTRLVYEYDENHNLLSINEGDEVISAFTYYPNGLIASIKGTNIPARQFSYDSDGWLKTEINALGQATTYEHDKRGNLIREIDPNGGPTLYKYDDQDRLLSITDPAGATTRYTYDIKGRLAQIMNATHGITRFEYNAIGRVSAKTDAAGRTTRYQYNPNGLVSSVTYPGGGTYHYTYDRVGNLIRTVNPLGGITERTYDAFGHVTSSTDPIGRTTKYEYSREGRLIKVIGPGENITQFKYDSKGRRQGVVGPAGQAVTCDRDNKGQITKIFFPEGRVNTYAYEDTGKIVNISNNMGQGSRYEFNSQGQVVKETNAQGIETNYQYDKAGNVIGVRDNFGESVSMQFNSQGLLASVTNAAKATLRYQYDLRGRLVELINPLNQMKRISYTPTGEIAQVTEPSGETARYEYDESGRLKKIQHPGGGIAEFTYDAMGNLLSRKNPLGATFSFAYDKAGQMISMIDAKGQKTSFTYDSAGRLLKKEHSAGKIINYKYDAIGNPIEIDNRSFPIRYAYDPVGRIVKIEYPALKRILKYEYDSIGLLSNFTNSEGQVIHYEHDSSKRISAIRLSDGKTFRFSYDAKNRLTSLLYPNGVKGIWEYDATGRAIRIAYVNNEGKTLSERAYTYDVNSNVLKIDNEKGQTFQYRYDANDQLLEEVGPSGMTRYSYLPGGNRRQIESKGKVQQCQYNQGDQLIRAGEASFKYDSNGNMMERSAAHGITKYIYDAGNQLIKVVLPDKSEISFGYAPTGTRIWRRDKNGLTYFVSDGIQMLAEVDETLKSKVNYLYAPGIDRPLSMSLNGEDYLYHSNGLGSITSITDSKGKVTASYETDAFGNLLEQTGTIPNPFIFTARELEPDIGLYFFRTRYYDPGLGRFLSMDPRPGISTRPGTFHPYIYALNNPPNLKDPFGTQAIPIQSPYAPLSSVDLDVDRTPFFVIGQEHPNLGDIDKYFKLPKGSVYGTYDPQAGIIVYRAGTENPIRQAGVVIHEGQHAITHQLSESYRPGSYSSLPVAKNEQISAWQEAHALVRDYGVSLDDPEVQGAIDYYAEHNKGDKSKLIESLRRYQNPKPTPVTGVTRPGVTVTGVAGGVATGATIAGGVVDTIASIEEGNTPIEATKETLRKLAEGEISTIKYGLPAAGVVAGGTYLIGGGTAVAGLVTVGVPVLTVVGAVAAVGGAYHAVDRLANAPAVKADRDFQETQYGWLQKIDNLVADMQGRITSALAGTNQEALAACRAIRGAVETANANKNSVQKLKNSLISLSAQIKETSSWCEQAKAMKARIDDINARIKGYENTAETAYGWAQGNQCSTKDDGARLRKLSGELEGLSKGVLQLAAEANAKSEDLKTIKNRVEVTKGAIGTAEEITGKIAAGAAAAASERNRGMQQISQVERLKKTLQEKSNAMQGQVMTFRSWFPSNLLAANENKFSNLLGTVNRFRDPGCDTEALTRELDQAMLESSLDNQASQGLMGSIRGTLSGCETISLADGVAGDIQGSVDHMLMLVAGVKIKADECTVKVSQTTSESNDRCNQIDLALKDADKAKDLNHFRALVEQAKQANCGFYQNAYNYLRNWEQRAQQHEDRCKNIDSALKEADRVKDLNRFRTLVEQARQENCSFYQNAYNYLQKWEQQAKLPPPKTSKPPTEQPVSEGEKQALINEINNVYNTRWLKHWCTPSWSGCMIVPKAAKDGLVWRVGRSTKRKQLDAIRNQLNCFDPCIMGKLNDAQRNGCTKNCEQKYPWSE